MRRAPRASRRRRSLAALAVTLCCALPALGTSACSGAQAGEDPSADAATAPPSDGSRPLPQPRTHAARLPDRPGLEHVARVSDILYRGAQPDGVEGYGELAKLGIKTVVSLREHHDHREEAEAAGLHYVSLQLQADVLGSEPPTDAQVTRFFQLLHDPERQPVYIHCMTGKDRTGTMAALYRLEVEGWSNEEAVDEMLAFGYHTIYRDLIRFVREYRRRGHGPGGDGSGGDGQASDG